MELFLWTFFEQTGNIEAYLLYKSVFEPRNAEVSKEQWRILEQKALL